MICAEALLLNGWGSKDPDFAAIVSLDKNPARFNKRIEWLIENRVPAFYVNDARWGGSCVLSAVDARGRNWWFNSPNEGRLPPGDAYLEVELDLDSPSVEVGVAEPRISASLTGLCEIYYADETPVFEPAAKDAMDAGDQSKLLAAIEPLRSANGKNIIVFRRWSMIAALLGKENLSKGWVDCLSHHVQLTDTPRLQTIEQEWRTLRGLSTQDGVAFLDQQLNRLDLSLDTANPQQKSSLVSALDGHPGLIVVTADLLARKPVESLIRDLRSRKGRLNEAIRKLFSLASLPTDEKTILAALKEVRIPIPMSLVETLQLGEITTALLLDLIRAGFVLRESASEISISPILRVAEIDLPELDSKLRIEFHRFLTQHFADLTKIARRDDYLSLAVEANYHASHAELPPPCNIGGILDGLNAAVSDEFARQNHGRVIAMLSNVSSSELPEDLQYMLACSFGWEGRFDEGFEIACRLSEKNQANASAFAEICKAALRSRQNDQAQRVVDYAEEYEHDSYLVDLYRGRLAELKGQVFEAVNHFEDASRKSNRDPWPYFYWARGLLRAGQPEKTLDTTSLGCDFIEGRHGRSVRNFEKALMSIELSALVQTGDTETAKNIVDTIDLSREENPETILSVGFVKASMEVEGTSEVEVLAHFERAVGNIKQSEKRKRFVQAKISLFRGKLFEQFGDLGRAQEEYSRAVREDAHNVHMKECLMRVSARLAREARTAGKDNAAKSSALHATELAKQILRYDSGHVRAIHMQEDMYREFGIDPK